MLEGTSEDARLNATRSIGDINGDGFEDLLVAGDSTSYILLGPVKLTGVDDVAIRAEIKIDQAFVYAGNIDGDQFNDLVFLDAVLFGNELFEGGEAPRDLTMEDSVPIPLHEDVSEVTDVLPLNWYDAPAEAGHVAAGIVKT